MKKARLPAPDYLVAVFFLAGNFFFALFAGGSAFFFAASFGSIKVDSSSRPIAFLISPMQAV